MRLTVTTTATNRPDILAATYESFTSRMRGVDFSKSTLYLNVDPLPISSGRKAAIKVARRFFGNVVHRLPKKANFTSAVNWLWSQPSDEFIFHLEDDWELLENISINTLLGIFKSNPILYQVALRAYRYKYRKFCLSPSLIRRPLYKRMGGRLDESINPELQLRFQPAKMRKRVTAYPDVGIIVKDIGREWIHRFKLRKPSKKCKFISWVSNRG